MVSFCEELQDALLEHFWQVDEGFKVDATQPINLGSDLDPNTDQDMAPNDYFFDCKKAFVSFFEHVEEFSCT